MKKYEIMVIISNSLKTAEAEKYAKENINKHIEEMGGKITFQDFWGERGFAYKIKGEKWGYYYVAQYELDASKTLVLRNELNIEPKIVRFLVTTIENDMLAPKTLKEIQSSHAEREKEEKIKEAEADAKSAAKKEAAKVEAHKEEAKAEPKTKGLKKDDVDKKLDQIIEDSTADL